MDYVNTGTGKFTEPVRWEAGVAPACSARTLCAPALPTLTPWHTWHICEGVGLEPQHKSGVPSRYQQEPAEPRTDVFVSS